MTDKNFRKSAFAFMALVCVALFSACRMFATSEPSDNAVSITSLSLAKASLSMKVGSMDYISVSVKPANEQKNINLSWSYDKSIIQCDVDSAWGVTITALKEGQTSLRCSYSGYDSTCIITVSGFADNYEETVEPYIYSSTSILQTAPGITEKVYVSLYGGSAADIDGYTWTCDNASVCSIQPTGQYCMITARDTGYARIKITHQKAAYPYYMGVYVFGDATKVSYITTSTNILTMNLADDEQTISVSLVNGKETSSDGSFSWEVVNDDGGCPIRHETNGNKAVITPVKAGSCTLRVTHPDAAYPLEILCRVISVVKNVYIEPDKTVVTLSGDTEETVKSTLKNIDIGEYDVDAYTYMLDDYNVAEIVGYVGNEVMLKGKANGSCKLLIGHEKAAYTREVLLIVNGQLTDAVDSSCYITTSQNYIRTKVGAEGTTINISLKGGDDGDEGEFSWHIRSTAADGSSRDVVSMDTAHGTVSHARSAAQTYAYGEAFIEPKCEGTAVITISHPKVHYPTEILVKVLDKDAILDSPLYFTGNGLLKILNGESVQYAVQLKGDNKTSGDDNGIKWSCDNPQIRISSSANIAEIKAPSLGTGNTISNITISHSKADADKKVLVLTADTQEELDNMKALYSDKLYYNFEVGSSAYLMTNYVGFDRMETTTDADGNKTEKFIPFDFSAATWRTSDSTICSIEKMAENPLTACVTGLKAGTATVTVRVNDGEGKAYTCEYTITVYPKGAIQTDPEVYFTTSQNVVNLSGAGKESVVRISAVNLSSAKYSKISWTVSDEKVATVIGNGTSATVKAVSEGEAVISVSHEDSQNTLKIYVRVGSEYIIPDAEPVVYISAQDVITMLKDDSAQKLTAVLVNYGGADTAGFSFAIDKEEVATISSQSTNGIAYIKPVSSGQAEVTITHERTDIIKKVLVVVGNSAEELSSFTYLTTSSNVVAVGEGNTKTVSVSVKNSDEVVIDGYTWTSSNRNVVDVTASGATAVFTGNSVGTAIITVRNKKCAYALEIIAQCVDPIAAAASPYIQLTSSVITVEVSSSYTSVTADLVGGSKSDFSDFVWTSSDSSVCVCYGQNEVGKIRALKAGTTYITVSHKKAAYSAQLLVVCDEVKNKECYISVPSSIISMKPTDSSQMITASLINGNDTDKYNFTWSLDVYDVVDFVYSANVCTITPKQQGQVTITVHHPKSAYDQQIVVTVQEYTSFAFPKEHTSITQGNVSFETMQVPTTKVATYVEYSVDNPAICSITGTKTTAQITAVAAGTTTVRAKLVASSTGVVQAKSEMLVYVKEAEVNAVYITSSSTIYTVNKGKSATLSASISGTGITTSDQYNLKWTTSDTDVVQIAGIKSDGTVTGQSIYVTALKAGEALITCSHGKAASDLQFYVVVPGTGEKTVTLNKTYISMLKGSSGTTLKATIENAESSSEYYDIVWSAVNASGYTDEVCRVMGSGQTVTIYPVSVGSATVCAQLPGSQKVATCDVVVEAGKSFAFESTTASVQPYHTKRYKYTVSPTNAVLSWTISQGDDYYAFTDLGYDEKGVGYVEIEGIKAGTGNIVCVTDSGAKGQMAVNVRWDYVSDIGAANVHLKPKEEYVFDYKVSPVEAQVIVQNPLEGKLSVDVSDADKNGNGKITLYSKKTFKSTNLVISLVNPFTSDTYSTKTVKVECKNDSWTPRLAATKITGHSDWNRIDGSDAIYLSDGASITANFKVAEEDTEDNVSYKIELNKTGIKGTAASVINCTSANGMVELSHDKDYKKYVYHVTGARLPTYGGTPITLERAKSLAWQGDTWDSGMKGSRARYRLYNSLNGTYLWSQTVERNSSGTTSVAYNQNNAGSLASYVSGSYGIADTPGLVGDYSKEEFESIPFWFVPSVSLEETNWWVSWGSKYSHANLYVVGQTLTFDGQSFTLNGIVFNKYVDATFGVSRDDSVTNSYLAYLKITMTCDMGSKTWTIPVHIEERANCNMYNVAETARGMDLGDYENSTDAQGTIKCPSCGKELDEEAEYCGGCGYVLYCPVCKAEHGNPDAASCECGYEWKVSTPKP